MKLKTFSALRASAAPLALLAAGITAAAGFVAPAMAQDYTSGALSGTVTDEAGATVSGATVQISSQSLGIERTVTSTAQGGFRATGLPAGLYNVDVSSANSGSYRAEGVRVQSSVVVDLTVPLTTGQAIVVTGSRIKQAFSGTTTGVNVDLVELTKNVAIGRDLSSVMLLAPGTSRGDSEFGNLVSIGGSSVAENAYYINGLNVTNFDNYLGSAKVPFEFYKSVEVKSGGYAAEYGRATGGIVNSVTKSGSNEYTVAGHINWDPNALRSKAKDVKDCGYTDDTFTDTSCFLTTDTHRDTASSYSAIVELGGPIIKDRLFVYGLAEFRKVESVTHDAASNIGYFRKNNDPYWGAKVDAYPIDSQHLEFTIFDTRNTTSRVAKNYTVDADGGISYGPGSTVDFNGGGVSWVGKYTGTMTDWLTLSAAYGVARDRFDNQPDNAGTPYISNSSGGTLNGVASGGLFNSQTLSTLESPYTTERKFFRADADIFLHLLGDHHIRGGYDVENNMLNHISVRTGAGDLCSSGFLSDAACALGGGAALYYRAGGVVEVNYYNSGGSFKAKNQAFYVQDEWQLTPRLTVNLGLRRDDFGVKKADGSTLVSLKGNYAPRLAASYKLFDDNSGTIKAAYGQYYLPVASNTAFRQASAEYYFRERFRYSSIGADGIPVLTTQVTNRGDYQSACPFGLTPVSSGEFCNVTGNGTVPDTSAAIAHNLKATKETEMLFGYEQVLGDWTVGLTYTYRKLDRSAEDMAIDAAVLAYCADNDIAGCQDTWTGYHQYVITNPGNPVVVNLRGLDGREVTFTADQLGYPKAARTYHAVDLTVSRPFKDGWSLSGSYTWSKSKGNSEGYVQSDFGQGDAGITQDFDQPGFMPGATGFLPNDRRHRFKVWGSVAMTNWLTVGMNAIVDSPRNQSCFGFNPTDVFANGYGAASHYCGGQLSPRGTAQKTDWSSQFDLSLRVRKELSSGSTLTLRADVFNLFNSHAITKRNEIGDLDAVYGTEENPSDLPTGYIANPSYGLATGYQAPRTVRIGADITF